MAKTFLTAEWRKLAMANYAVDPAILLPYLPEHTELDLWNGSCYVSLVGFMFLNTRVKGVRVPMHSNFEEVNLRFYVRYNAGDEWKRGVVFIREIVPRPALTLVANALYGEPYVTMPMAHSWNHSPEELRVDYRWKNAGSWHSFGVTTASDGIDLPEGSKEEFITEHFWGYTKRKRGYTSEYGVEHPRWKVYPVKSYTVDVDFAHIYGAEFGFLNELTPASVFLAEGSEIAVKSGRKITSAES
jgi:uncharacterized protein YqjF (DUF2071 family)